MGRAEVECSNERLTQRCGPVGLLGTLDTKNLWAYWT